MVELSYPGVYIIEVPPALRAITAASTSTAAFIGMAEKGPVNEARRVTSFMDFLETFGGFTTKEALNIEDKSTPPNNDIYLPYAVWAFFQNGGRMCYIIRLAPDAKPSSIEVPRKGSSAAAFTVSAISPGEMGNKLFVAVTEGTIDLPGPPDDPTKRKPTYKIVVTTDEGRTLLESFDGVTMDKDADNSIDAYINGNSRYIRISDVKPGTIPKLKPQPASSSGTGTSPTPSGEGTPTPSGVGTAVVTVQDAGYRLEKATPGRDVTDGDVVDQLTVGKSALDKLTDVSLIAAPGFTSFEVINAGFTYAERHRNGMGDAFFIADVPVRIEDKNEVVDFVKDKLFQPNNNGYGALYFPWIYARDQLAKGRNRKIQLPPSGFIAGIYARIDNVRGVWKAPAGTEAGVSGHQGLTASLTDMDQGVINLAGVNALRTFAGYGMVAWGSRTVSHDIAWRYVPVRRMANFLKSSIYDGIQWAVFEPNDAPLWDALRLTIGGFMMDLFRQRALQGSTPEEAFFVKCDSETTTETDQQNGIVNIQLGFAPLKPAEFVVVRLSQKVAQQQT
jgi:Bacteriophage tail sheath protein